MLHFVIVFATTQKKLFKSGYIQFSYIAPICNMCYLKALKKKKRNKQIQSIYTDLKSIIFPYINSYKSVAYGQIQSKS